MPAAVIAGATHRRPATDAKGAADHPTGRRSTGPAQPGWWPAPRPDSRRIAKPARAERAHQRSAAHPHAQGSALEPSRVEHERGSHQIERKEAVPADVALPERTRPRTHRPPTHPLHCLLPAHRATSCPARRGAPLRRATRRTAVASRSPVGRTGSHPATCLPTGGSDGPAATPSPRRCQRRSPARPARPQRQPPGSSGGPAQRRSRALRTRLMRWHSDGSSVRHVFTGIAHISSNTPNRTSTPQSSLSPGFRVWSPDPVGCQLGTNHGC